MITVVLVEPMGDMNIGAVSRAMMNTDVDKLILVNPQCNHLSESSSLASVHAQDILKNAKVVPSLDLAIDGMDLKVAITRRVGQYRKRDFFLSDFAEFVLDYNKQNVALVFGREMSGLTTDEVFCCDLICSIPASKKLPSLNLAQAVMLVLHQLYTAELNSTLIRTPVSRKNFDGMIDSITDGLSELGFFKKTPSWRLENYIRKILLRSRMDYYDVRMIDNLFVRIKGMAKKLRKEVESGKAKSQKSKGSP